jgi:DNA-directed RNA polymerase subunit RPC12/RpoP
MITHIYSYKCMACDLHFNIYSWNEHWDSEHECHCPECPNQHCLTLHHRESDDEIFMFVPGFSSTPQ